MTANNIFWYILIGAAIGSLIGFNKNRISRQSGIRMPKRTFPNEWRRILTEKVVFYTRLSAGEKTEFERRVHIFLLNVKITGVNTEVTHEDRILIASGAIIPIFRFDRWNYANLNEVQLYPDKFPIPGTDKMANGLVGWGAMEGKMLLSRKAVVHGFYDQTDNQNVAIHEFIHILDKQDGKVDGVLGKLMTEIDLMPWLHVINLKMKEIDFGGSSIRDYGAANKAEFLAVVSEFFFENPDKMKSEHPALYNALDSFYNPKGKRNKATFY